MVDTRRSFHTELDDLEARLLDVADRDERLLDVAIDALLTGDPDTVARVEAEVADLNRIYLETHNRWILLMARQQPMGSDLRLMSALLHLNVTLDRTASQILNIAKLGQLAAGLPTRARLVEQIREMADLVRPMIRTAAEAFLRRDAEEARLLPAMDEPVDRINRLMYREVVNCAPTPELIEWATHMMMAARALERMGDQAVDIGEQVVFLTTGEFQEFSEEGISGRGGDE